MRELDKDADLSNVPASAWREPAALTLDERGMIMDCSNSGEKLFGYSRSELARQHVSSLLPQLSGVELVQNGQPNPRFDFLCHIGHLFQVRRRHNSTFLSELTFVCLNGAGKTMLRLIAQPLTDVAA